MPKRKRIRPVGIVVVPRTKKDQERRDALSPREALKRKAKELMLKGASGPSSSLKEALKRKTAEELTGRLGGARLGKQKTKEKAQKGKKQAEIKGPLSDRFSQKERDMLRDLLRKPKEPKKPKEPETKYPIRRVPKTRKKPPTSRRI